jgi:hypothetical protein
VAFQPRCIYGYASSVALLAAHARERGRRLALPRLKVVCTTGEPLYEHQRELIGEVYGAPVANEFGSRDIGFTAHETPQGQMLLMSESIILEVLDEAGQPVPPGTMGEAVMTGLCSEAQPFIRYRTGDMVRLSPEPDRAGRGLHVIAEVVGRSTDFLVRGDGTIMHALAGIYVLRAVEGVAEFKLVQHTLREVEVLVVPMRAGTRRIAQAIEAGLRQRLGDDVRVVVRSVERIAPEASGKHRYVVSHVPLGGELGVAVSTPPEQHAHEGHRSGPPAGALQTLAAAPRWPGPGTALRGAPRRQQPHAVHLAATIDWLCRAQDVRDGQPDAGGVSAGWSFEDGWLPSYPETTGYIIETLLAAARALDRPELVARAQRMIDWELSIQQDDGAFPGHFGEPGSRPVIFNTGQIMHGMVAGYTQLGR